MAKYGIEEMIKKSYPNNMSADEDKLTDTGILAALSHIQHTRSGSIQRKHNQISLTQIIGRQTSGPER